MNTNFSGNLPDPLRIKPTGVQANQISVYEDFGLSLFLIIYSMKCFNL